MALINHEKKEINAKIVYYGPGLSGKTTNIKFIYDKMKPEFRGKFKLLNTNSGKMLFFDFMRPDQIGIKDYDVRFHIYTVPGEISDFSIWKTVLKGTDGLVFVADSEPYKLPDNLQSYEKLKEYMETLPEDTRDFPCILQCNKQDIPGATSLEEMKDLLHSTDLRMIPASTRKGEGVLNTLSTIVKMVIQKLQNIPLSETEEEAVVVTEPEAVQPSFAGENVLSCEPPLQMSTEMEEEVTLEPALEIPAEHEFPYAQELGSATGIQSEDSFNIQETGHFPGEINLTGENLQYGTASLTEPPPIIEESDFEPVQEITPEQEFSIASEIGLTIAQHHTDAAEISEAGQPPMEIDFAGEMELVAPGHFRLPVTIKFGRDVKTLSLDLKLSVEIPQA
jgi:signal recognition particle receptor subunit beta